MRQVENQAQQFVDSSGEPAVRRAEEGYILSSLLLKQDDETYGKLLYDGVDANLNTVQRRVRDMAIEMRCSDCRWRLPLHIFAVILKHGGDAPEVQATTVDAKARVEKLEQLLHRIIRDRTSVKELDDIDKSKNDDRDGRDADHDPPHGYDEQLKQLHLAKANISIFESILPKIKVKVKVKVKIKQNEEKSA